MRMDILKYVFIRSLKLCNFIFKDKIMPKHKSITQRLRYNLPADVKQEIVSEWAQQKQDAFFYECHYFDFLCIGP